MNKIMNKKGVSLVELIVAMAVGIIIMAAIYSLMNTGQKSSSSLARKVLTQQDARAVMDLMAAGSYGFNGSGNRDGIIQSRAFFCSLGWFT